MSGRRDARVLDIAGKKFNMLTALRESSRDRAGVKWICLCECGTTKVIRGTYLRALKTKSCGCLRTHKNVKRDLTGKRFGKILVVKKVYVENKGRTQTKWMGKCDCGKIKYVYPSLLLSGHTTSCGCSRPKRSPRKAYLIMLFKRYRKKAKETGREFSLNIKEAKNIFKSNCHYCGQKPQQGTDIFRYNGIDRYDNTKGYIPENCLPCCIQCNRAKRDLTANDFINWICSVYDHLNLNQIG